jgi:xylulokinase
VVDDHDRIVATGAAPVERFTTPDGGIEQDIEQIWDATCAAIRQAIGGLDPNEIQAVGVSSQGGAMQLLDQQERPIGRVISWLDSRGQPFDQAITRELGENFLAEHIGHGVSTMTIGQVLRLREQMPDQWNASRYIGFVGDVIVGRLCGRRAHDPTSLAIAMLYNPWQKRADPELLARLDIQDDQLPDLLSATTSAGAIHNEAARQTGLRMGTPVAPAIHDQYAVSLGAASVHEGDLTFGAGTAWVLLANGSQLKRPITADTFVCPHPVPGLFGQMLSMRNGGSAIEWVLKLLGLSGPSADSVDTLLGEIPPQSDGLCFWPLLSPAAGANDAFQSGGRISGLTLSHRPLHLLRAVIEGLACELARHLTLLTDAGLPVKRLTMCGSAASSRLTPQIIADITQRPVACVDAFDMSSLGAAVVARALAEGDVGFTRQTAATVQTGRSVLPGPDAAAYRDLFEQYMQPFGAPREP